MTKWNEEEGLETERIAQQVNHQEVENRLYLDYQLNSTPCY